VYLFLLKKKNMDTLASIDGAGYYDAERNDIFNTNLIAPIEGLWFMRHNVDEMRPLLLEYVNKYRLLVSAHIAKNPTFSKIVESRKHSYARQFPRIIVGCTVNISALGSTNAGSFQIDKVMHKKPRGILVPNRPRNAALHIRLRAKPSIIEAPKEFDDFVQKHNMAIMMFDEEFKQAMRGVVGDRIVRAMKSYHFSPKLLGDMAGEVQKKMQDLQLKQNHKQINASNNPLSNLFSFGNKPIDETYLTYTSGSYVLTGAKHPYMSAFSMWILVWSFTCESIPITHLASFSVQNIVATYRMPITLDLPRLEKFWGQATIEYVESHFPAAICTIDKGTEKLIIELANITKSVRRDIIMDDSWKTDEQRKSDKRVRKMLRSQDAYKIQKVFDQSFVFEKKQQREPIIDEDKINKKLAKIFKGDVANMPSEMKTRYMNKIIGGKPVALIYATGAFVLTGWKDQDVQIAAAEVMYDMLMHFKIRCEEEDNKIANTSSGAIVVDAPESECTDLILGGTGYGTTIGEAPAGSSMRAIAHMARVDDMARIARSQTRHEVLNQGLIVIKKTKREQPNQALIPFSREATQKSRFNDLIKNVKSGGKRQRKD
jgi:TATA-box binding protein (TBP) (component of TFIID and TFIIIB)